MQRIISTTIEKYKRIDCLINNAGTHPPHATIDNISSEQFNSLININLTGYFRFCKFALPSLRKVQGCIINMASLVAELGDYHGVEYSASKGGIVSMTKALAVDEAEHHVRVNSVSPGNIRTPLLDYMCSLEPDPKKALKDCDNTQILGNIGEGRDVAMACLYLAADAPFVTGTNLNVSGGAEVTGANKGIGYAVVQALCKQFDGDVLLTGRSEERCKAAVAELQKQGMSPKYHQLDIDDQASINKLRDFVKEQYGGIDVLVNNAGIAFKQSATESFGEQARVSCGTNFTGTLNVCNTLFPLLRPHARVSNVSSFVSQMTISKCSKEIQEKFKNPSITMDQLKGLMQQFIDAAQTGSHQKQGFADWSYGMSKVGVTVMSFIQQRELNSDPREDIVVNACDPGYVDTDMTSHKGTKTVEQGADTPVYVAMLPPGTTSPKGDFVSDRTIKKWG
ncbi:CBR1 [Mytilus edulis]|uniref:carbonyl reductase (NADPH) n=2 Tax=Mytilus TaxID=6548 RepID=A0A8S3RVK5_MYTED|nr:CBR1 [Mytilus edulis]